MSTGEQEPHEAELDSDALSRRGLSGLSWSFLGVVGETVLRFGVLALLARLLRPADFGVFAASLIVVEIAEFITAMGIGRALIQRAELGRHHVSTALAFTLGLGGALALGLWALAPVLADLLRVPEVAETLPWLGLCLPLGGAALVGKTLAMRALAFRSLAVVDLLSFVVYGAVAAALAFGGHGLWSLVLAHLIHRALRAVALLLVQPQPLGLAFDRAALAELLRFGGGVTLGDLFQGLAAQTDRFIVARSLGEAVLGLYERAHMVVMRGSALLNRSWSRVIFATASRLQDAPADLGAMLGTGLALSAVLLLPLTAFTVLLAPEIVALLLGTQWQAAVPMLRILAAGLFLQSGLAVAGAIVQASAAVYRAAWRHALFLGAVLVGTLVGLRWGGPGVAVALLIAWGIQLVLLLQLCFRLTQVDVASLIVGQLRGLLLAIAIAALLWPQVAACRHFALPHWTTLCLAAGMTLLAMGLALRSRPAWLLGEGERRALRRLGEGLPSSWRRWVHRTLGGGDHADRTAAASGEDDGLR